MALHFPVDDLKARQKRVLQEMARRDLDAMLLFRQESMYYLTGYDTMGYISFQAAILTADGQFTLLTREPDRRAARMTSIIEDVRIYDDHPDINPAEILSEIAVELVGSGKRFGVEYDSFGLSAKRANMVETAFAGKAELVEATDLVADLRLIKTPGEIKYVRKAAEIADACLNVAMDIVKPGLTEGELMGAMHNKMFEMGGDYAASRWILGTGEHAMLVRHFTGHHNVIQETDQVQLEFGAAYLHYHGCLFHTLYVGSVTERQKDLRKLSIEAFEAAKEACKPGNPVSAMFDAYRGVAEKAGERDCALNGCGYSIGIAYPPTWMEGAFIFRGNDRIIEPGMVFFPHMVFLDTDAMATGCAGATLLVNETGSESLSKIPHTLQVL
ncbi:M24 family metallopeptidase [Henriciella aquimarina]|uniref:M24 family metallopeptidase n=1 Tax=Henriciella aquimarina TaxID=545261 RepID=UPI000A07401E|nr:Xaa-Pro peptidase family protein [Henriciella aquimarina]